MMSVCCRLRESEEFLNMRRMSKGVALRIGWWARRLDKGICYGPMGRADFDSRRDLTHK